MGTLQKLRSISQLHTGWELTITAAITVTKCVTNSRGKPGQWRDAVTNLVTNLRAIQGKLTIVGNKEKRRATQGNGKLGLITQRSKVQILPPQPTDSIAVVHAFGRYRRPYNLGVSLATS